MKTRQVRILTILMGILLLVSFLVFFLMQFVTGANLIGLTFYLTGIGLSLSFLAEWGISKTIRAKKFEISFKQIRWSRIFEFAVFTYWVLYGSIQLVEGFFFPNFLDWRTWALLGVYAFTYIIGNYVARHFLYPKGDVRHGLYDALAEKTE